MNGLSLRRSIESDASVAHPCGTWRRPGACGGRGEQSDAEGWERERRAGRPFPSRRPAIGQSVSATRSSRQIDMEAPGGENTASRSSSNHTKPKPGGLRATHASLIWPKSRKKSRRSRASASGGKLPTNTCKQQKGQAQERVLRCHRGTVTSCSCRPPGVRVRTGGGPHQISSKALSALLQVTKPRAEGVGAIAAAPASRSSKYAPRAHAPRPTPILVNSLLTLVPL